MAKGYCPNSADDVAAYLGQTLDSAQTTVAVGYLDAAEQVVDAIANTSWLTGPITGESYSLTNQGTRLYLRQNPITSVEGITVRALQVGAVAQVLAVGVDYELLDPTAGILLLSSQWLNSGYARWYGEYGGALGRTWAGGSASGQVALVSYTPAQTVPPAVSLATAMIVAHWIEFMIDPNRYGIQEYNTTASGVQKQFTTQTVNGVRLLPQEAINLLNQGVARILL